MNEVQMKEFRVMEAKRHHVSEWVIHRWFYDGKHYPGLVFRRVNERVIFLSGPPIDTYVQTRALQNGTGSH